jgi:hypothetical protein
LCHENKKRKEKRLSKTQTQKEETMIHLLNSAIQSRITALPFIERYGGAAMPVNAPSSYIGPDGNSVSVLQAFPVSCSIEGDCEAEGYYTKLLPDDRYKSVAYIEATGPASFSQENMQMYKVRQRAKFVAWLNMQRIGAIGCGLVEVFALQAAKAIQTLNNVIVMPAGYEEPVRVRVTTENLYFDALSVFGQYSYAVNARLMLHPYAAFAIDIEMLAMMPAKCLCLPEFEPIECITQW